MSAIVFSALIPWAAWIAVASAACAAMGFALWRGDRRFGFRASALALGLLALSGPLIRTEHSKPLSDIVVALVDQSASQKLNGREAQTNAAMTRLRQQTEAAGAELRVINVGDDAQGTRAMAALKAGLAEVDPARLSAVVVLSDGQVHDADLAPQIDAPMHLLVTGTPRDWDRRLTVPAAPAFGIVGEQLPLSLRIDDLGAAPESNSVTAEISFDGGPSFGAVIPLGKTFELPVVLPHGGSNLIEISTPVAAGELTGANNRTVLQINGVRDRLRVLLISGEPYLGTRTWRNLLTSDPGVDLVHFTILRPPEAIDGTPASELALIAFPTEELFVDKIDEFDLIIFDRYSLRGILQPEYLANIRRYTEEGGALLIAAGPEFAGGASLARSALGPILPAMPNQKVIERAFRPAITQIGRRHPVTRHLERGDDQAPWGRWMRQIGLDFRSGDIVMEGATGAPLLVIDRVGEGRVALLASDQAWLWARGYEGGGPQAELLRNLSYWLMREPDLEEEALAGVISDASLEITRHTLDPSVPGVTVTDPDGLETTLEMRETASGRFTAQMPATLRGIYRLNQGTQSAVVAAGAAHLHEYATPIASGAPMAEAIAAAGGGILHLSGGSVSLRTVRDGGAKSGDGWIGMTARGARQQIDVALSPLVPDWVWLGLILACTVLGWLTEGGRMHRPRGGA